MLALYQGFYDAYAFVSRVPLDKDKLVFPANNDTVKHLIQRMDDYFDMTIAQDTDGILNKLRNHRYLLELRGGTMEARKLRRPHKRFWIINYFRWRYTPRSDR